MTGAPPSGDQFRDICDALGLGELQLRRVIQAAGQSGQSLIATIVRLGLASEEKVVAALAQTTGLQAGTWPAVDGWLSPASPLTLEFQQSHLCVPLEIDDAVARVGVVDPTLPGLVQAIRFAVSPRQLFLTVLPLGPVERYLRSLLQQEPAAEAELELGTEQGQLDADTLRSIASEEPIVRLLDGLITDAIEARATDLHLEPKPDKLVVRARRDGRLGPFATLPAAKAAPLISRLKVLADLDVANARSPQDGRATANCRGRQVDLRISCVPAVFGESVAVRILDRSAVSLDLDQLGLTGRTGELIRDLTTRPHGLTIITGPTGSGKTTTLYGALDIIRHLDLKILTVEDPIEYRFEDVNQVQVNEAAGVSFATTLRAFLRQDPDVILVGEIRDSETARLAVQAALTGHLVLATLHTNSAAAAPARLIDMGVEPYLLASVLNGVIAQRLVRRLCTDCPKPGAGCASCGGTGYRGRIAIAEAFDATADVRAAIHRGTTADGIEHLLAASGFQSLVCDGEAKVAAGFTTMDEVCAVVGRPRSDLAA